MPQLPQGSQAQAVCRLHRAKPGKEPHINSLQLPVFDSRKSNRQTHRKVLVLPDLCEPLVQEKEVCFSRLCVLSLPTVAWQLHALDFKFMLLDGVTGPPVNFQKGFRPQEVMFSG